MDFINEMENMFLQAVQGAVQPALWEAWWDAHAEQLKAHLSPGYFLRILQSIPWRRWLSTGKRGWGRRRDRLRIRLRRFLIHPVKFRPCLIRFRPHPRAPAQFYRRIARRKTKASCTFA